MYGLRVRSHRDHVERLMREAGWSRQLPIQRASQRNEEAIKQWGEERLPASKKSRRGAGHHPLGRRSGVFPAAASGVHLGTTWPNAGAAGAPHPRSPLVDQRHHVQWTLCVQVRPVSYDAAGVVGFLCVLLHKISGKVVVIWDQSPLYRGQEIRVFLARGAAKRLRLEQLPGSAPELNPDEGLWNY